VSLDTLRDLFVDVDRSMFYQRPPPAPVVERRAGEHEIRTTVEVFGRCADNSTGWMFTLKVCDHCRTLIVERYKVPTLFRRFATPEGEVLDRIPPVCLPFKPRAPFGGP
jgi:hypothetical protein